MACRFVRECTVTDLPLAFFGVVGHLEIQVTVRHESGGRPGSPVFLCGHALSLFPQHDRQGLVADVEEGSTRLDLDPVPLLDWTALQGTPP